MTGDKSDSAKLEKLCYPIFSCLCNWWQFSRLTNEIDKERFRRDITNLLEDAKKKAADDPVLDREFAWMEKPLVFFIDYMVKEGRFPFRQDWRELARNYNELSGDEKFFNLLSETLDDSDMQNTCVLFYIMLGLGFDGIYLYKRDQIKQYMQLCMERSYTTYDIYSKPFVSPPKPTFFFKRRRKLTIWVAIIASVLFMVLCLVINGAVFSGVTKNYRDILKKTTADSPLFFTDIPASGELN